MDQNYNIGALAHSIYSSVIMRDKPKQWTAPPNVSNRTLLAVWQRLQQHIGDSASIDIVLVDQGGEYRHAIEHAIMRYTASVPIIVKVSPTQIRVMAAGLGTIPEVLH